MPKYQSIQKNPKLTLDQFQGTAKAPTRDYNKYPITAPEINGLTQQLKQRNRDNMNKLMDSRPKKKLTSYDILVRKKPTI